MKDIKINREKRFYETMLKEIDKSLIPLNSWEMEFIDDISDLVQNDIKLTERQEDVLVEIWEKKLD